MFSVPLGKEQDIVQFTNNIPCSLQNTFFFSFGTTILKDKVIFIIKETQMISVAMMMTTTVELKVRININITRNYKTGRMVAAKLHVVHSVDTLPINYKDKTLLSNLKL